MKKLLAIVVLGLLWTSISLASETLGEQLIKLESLYKRGTITKEEFTKAKAILLKIDTQSSEKVKEAKTKREDISYSRKKELDKINLNVSNKKFDEAVVRKFRDSSRETYEKMEILFNKYRFYTSRPGGVRISNRKTGKKIAMLYGNGKIKFYDKSAKDKFEIIYIKPEDRKFDKSKILALNKLDEYGTKLNKFLSDKVNSVAKEFGAGKKELPGAIQIRFNGALVLNWERIFVPKHQANFYQMAAFSTLEPFHYYVVTKKGNAAAFNMEKFGRRIDIALEKAKVKIAKEHNLTVEEVEYVIAKKRNEDLKKLSSAVGRETDKILSDTIDTQVAAKVDTELAKELEKTIGESTAKEMMAAIEVSTGAEIDAALEEQVASLIDDAVAEAIEEGYSQAAIEAGLSAYMAVLAAGGTDEQAVAAADAAGCAADSNAC